MPKNDNETIHITNVPPELKIEAQILALKEGRSLSDVLRELLEKWVDKQSQQSQKKGG